jgi:hypothetical protein
MKKRLSPRVALLIIAAMFILPLALAWLMYTGSIGYRPASTRNLGNLVEPPLPMSWSTLAPAAGEPESEAEPALDGHWVVLRKIPVPCEADCISAVTVLRQIHRAAGRQQDRIRIALLLPDEPPPALADKLNGIYPQFLVLEDPTGQLRETLQRAAADGSDYLIDPLGNIMMSYASGYDPNDLKRDLKRLLTWSKLDEQ